MNTTSSTASTMLMMWRAGRMIGAPLIRADSFRNAITEPVKVSAPMATPSDISIRLCAWMWPGVPMSKASGAKNAPAATSTAAMPTSEWKAATSSGIDVIGTRRAMTAPMLPPIATPRMTSTQAMPSAGGWLAKRGDDRDRHAGHAEEIAAPARGRARQAAQRQDEQHTRHEIEECRQIGVHCRCPVVPVIPLGARRVSTWPSSCTSPACAG